MKKSAPALYRHSDEAVFALGDDDYMEHVCELVRLKADPVPPHCRDFFSQDLRTLLLAPIDTFICRLYETGRGAVAKEYATAKAFGDTVEELAQLFALREGTSMDSHETSELADNLKSHWLKFIAYAASSLMSEDLPRSLGEAEATSHTNAKSGSTGGKNRVKKRYAEIYERLDPILDGYIARGEEPIIKALAFEYKVSDQTVRNRKKEREKKAGK